MEKLAATCSHTEDREEKANNEHIPNTEALAIHDAEQDHGYRIGWRSFLAITALALANCCAALSNTSNTTIRFQIEAVGGENLASWIGNASFLTTLCIGPVFGFLSDRFGKKWFIVGGAAVGVIGACIAGTSNTVERIIAGQALSGLANAGCIVSVAASQEVTPNRYRPWAMGYTQALASTAALLGTYCAGAFVKYKSWRWSYYLNAFAYFIAGVSIACTYFPPPPAIRRVETLPQIFSQLDYIGIVTLSGSLAALILGLTWGGTTYAWSSGTVIATLAAGCVGLLLLGLYEGFVKKDGLFDHRLFENRNFPILLFVCTIDGMLLLGVNVLYSQEIASLFTTDSVRIAVILSPYLITSLFGCIPAGWLMAYTKSYRTLLVGALVWCSIFTGLMALITPDRLKWTYAFTTMFGIGTAVTTVIPITALALSVPSFLLGTAGTISISCRALGGIIGITIFTAIHSNKFASELPQHVSQAVLATTQGSMSQDQTVLRQVLGALANQSIPPPIALEKIQPPLSETTITSVLGALSVAQTNSWKWVWVAVSALVALNALVVCTARTVRERMNHHVESALEDSSLRDHQVAALKN